MAELVRDAGAAGPVADLGCGPAASPPTCTLWGWSAPEAGLATMDAWKAGAGFAAFKRAFEARGCVPYLARRVEDGRRNPTVWPTVPAVAPPSAATPGASADVRPA